MYSTGDLVTMIEDGLYKRQMIRELLRLIRKDIKGKKTTEQKIIEYFEDIGLFITLSDINQNKIRFNFHTGEGIEVKFKELSNGTIEVSSVEFEGGEEK